MKKFTSYSEKETMAIAQRLSKNLVVGDIICLQGDLGAGKTTFVKGLGKGFNVKAEDVNSPTFVLMNVYKGKLPIYHFDLYRIDESQLFSLDYEEYFYGKGICVIEWSERLKEFRPKKYIKVELKHKGETERSIKISVVGKGNEKRLKIIDARP